MKKLILALIASLTITTPVGSHEIQDFANFYAETGIITSIEYADDNLGCLMEITVANGNMFCYYSEDNNDYLLYDLVSMIMYDNGTQIVYDDEILKVQYSGVIEHFEQYIQEEECYE